MSSTVTPKRTDNGLVIYEERVQTSLIKEKESIEKLKKCQSDKQMAERVHHQAHIRFIESDFDPSSPSAQRKMRRNALKERDAACKKRDELQAAYDEMKKQVLDLKKSLLEAKKTCELAERKVEEIESGNLQSIPRRDEMMSVLKSAEEDLKRKSQAAKQAKIKASEDSANARVEEKIRDIYISSPTPRIGRAMVREARQMMTASTPDAKRARTGEKQKNSVTVISNLVDSPITQSKMFDFTQNFNHLMVFGFIVSFISFIYLFDKQESFIFSKVMLLYQNTSASVLELKDHAASLLVS